MTAQDRLARRARVHARLARLYRQQASRTHGIRAKALRAAARDAQAEALRLGTATAAR